YCPKIAGAKESTDIALPVFALEYAKPRKAQSFGYLCRVDAGVVKIKQVGAIDDFPCLAVSHLEHFDRCFVMQPEMEELQAKIGVGIVRPYGCVLLVADRLILIPGQAPDRLGQLNFR